MSSILFRGFDKIPNRYLGFGDVIMYYMVCYFKAKKLGHDDVHVVFPSLNPSYVKMEKNAYYIQPSNFLPITLHRRDEKFNNDDYDEVIDISEKNSLFHGYKGMKFHFWETEKYLNKYYLDTNEPPYLNIERTYKGKPYIIMHYRNMKWPNVERNTSSGEFSKTLEILKDRFKDKYEYWKCGETSLIDSNFDKVLEPMWNNIDGFTSIVRNSSLVVSCSSGPPSYAWFFEDIPIINISTHYSTSYYNPKRWRSICGTEFGNIFPEWLDDRCLYLYKNKFNTENLINFLERHKL